MVKIKWLTIVLSFLFIADGFTQSVNRYMAFFSDKANSIYSINQPEAFLSAKAISRRSRQGIAIIEEDIPVNDSYVQQIKNLGIEVFYASRWLNGILIQTADTNVPTVEALSFVDSVVYLAPGTRLSYGARKSSTMETNATQAINDAQLASLGANLLHNRGYFGKGITVAFFDGGFVGVDQATAFAHIFTDNRLLFQYNFVEHSSQVYKDIDHGTQAFSTVSAVIDGQYQGIAPQSTFMLCTTEDASSEYKIEEYNWLLAAEKADSAGVDIISNSLGYDIFDDPSMSYSFDKLDGQTAIITQAANKAFQKGMLVVTSSGNLGNTSTSGSEWQEITAPADAKNIISVGSITSDGQRSSFSSRGPTADGRIKPEVVAYGSSTSVIGASGVVGSNSGTSFAAPQIAGLAALLWEANPTYTNIELRDLILSMGSQTNTPDNVLGYGIPNYGYVLSLSSNLQDNYAMNIFPNPVAGDWITIDAVQGSYNLEIITTTGQIKESQQIQIQNGGVEKINISNLPAGIYLLQLYNKNNRFNKRFVKF